MPVIVLTSFQKAAGFAGRKLSVARFQPKGFAFDSLPFLAAVDKNDKKMSFEQYIDPLHGFEKALLQAYQSRWTEIDAWLNGLKEDETSVLCCWCPYSESSKEEMKAFKRFACHTGIIGQIVERLRPDVTIVLDNDRHKHLIDEWKPKNYITEDDLHEREGLG